MRPATHFAGFGVCSVFSAPHSAIGFHIDGLLAPITSDGRFGELIMEGVASVADGAPVGGEDEVEETLPVQ